MLPTHRDEPRCESEGQLYYRPCIIRKHTRTHISCEAHLEWSRPSCPTDSARPMATRYTLEPAHLQPKATNPRYFKQNARLL